MAALLFYKKNGGSTIRTLIPWYIVVHFSHGRCAMEMSKSELNNLIDEWIIGKNAERDRAILKRRLIDGVCYEPLAEEFGLSVRWVKYIVYKKKEVIFKNRED